MIGNCCLHCAYFAPEAEPSGENAGLTTLGECRRRCPTPRLTYEGRHCDFGLAIWPRIWGEAWCGEFAPRARAAHDG